MGLFRELEHYFCKEKLGVKGKGREVLGGDGSYELRESRAPYRAILGHENDSLRPQNAYFGDDIP